MSKSYLLPLILFSVNLYAGLKLPTGLDQEKRKTFVKSVLSSSSYKYLSLGYTLGGYEGFELSASLESFPLSKGNILSSSELKEKDYVVQNVTIGKGMFENVDMFFTFSPFIFQKDISIFGMAMKYVFYIDSENPFNLSVLLHGNAVNFANLVGAQSTGLDIIGSYFLKYWTFYLAVGQQRTLASFVGGAQGLTQDLSSANEDLYLNRFYSGFSYDFGMYQASFELQKIESESLAFKLGKRF
ncbi:MAG: hypothetical protein L6Q37_14050 [Bdellovibrionaceae bacterium]|nr:hypothetical protein [Pseudobdellovibrionaceae bacterium]NUM59538.1 hypothetical protein [Pseudobdellovibrionaceae bacterium]